MLVDGSRMRARDFVPSVPAFAALPAETDLGPSPAGTMARIFTKAQLVALLEGTAPGGLPDRLCVERRREAVSMEVWQASVEEAMTKHCRDGEWRAKVIEAPEHRFPTGKLSFAPTGLLPSRSGAQTWRGAIHLSDKSSVPVWVRLDLSVRRRAAVLSRDLAAGAVISATDFQWDNVWAPPLPGTGLCAAGDADWQPEGMIARRTLRAGALLTKSDFRRAPAVQRGDAVEVEAQAGSARIRIPAVADRDAQIGESIPVTSSWNGSKITARVTGERKAKVD